ncbi:MiaB/RimO family radical SAM methylthiotransferase [Candidatus Margulisiibacteriota bacterium]
MKKAAFYTLGCRSNQYETEVLKKDLSKEYKIIDGFNEEADLFVINTCTVTHDAERKSRQAIRRALREGKKVVVAGCYANLEKQQIKKMFPDVEILKVNGTANSFAGSTPLRVRANLMLESGCENFCAYCIVPYARGKIKSKPAAEAVKEAEAMVKNGVREIILTGINLGAYQYSLVEVLDRFSMIKELLRIRISSIEPMYITPELIDTVAKLPKVCNYFHIPLQSGDDKILKAMGRKYTVKEYIHIIDTIRKVIPDCGITTDLIAGLPGEDDNSFNTTVTTINRIRFSGIHLFPYSKRKGTRAAKMDNQVGVKTIKKRMETLQKLRDMHKAEFISRFIGKEVEILVESKGEGLTGNYIRVKIKEIGSPIS